MLFVIPLHRAAQKGLNVGEHAENKTAYNDEKLLINLEIKTKPLRQSKQNMLEVGQGKAMASAASLTKLTQP